MVHWCFGIVLLSSLRIYHCCWKRKRLFQRQSLNTQSENRLEMQLCVFSESDNSVWLVLWPKNKSCHPLVDVGEKGGQGWNWEAFAWQQGHGCGCGATGSLRFHNTFFNSLVFPKCCFWQRSQATGWGLYLHRLRSTSFKLWQTTSTIYTLTKFKWVSECGWTWCVLKQTYGKVSLMI